MNMPKQISLTVLAFLTSLFSVNAATIVWTNTAGGGWNEAINWSPNQVPGSGDTVMVTNDVDFTLNIDGVANAGNLILGTTDLDSTNTQVLQVQVGNTFILNGTLTVSTNGQFNLNTGSVMIGTNAILDGTLNGSGATLSGTLTIESNSVLNVNPPGMTFNGYFAGIGVLYNYGTVNWSSTSIYEDNNGVIYNYGLWLAQTDGIIYGRSSSGNGAFINYGIFSKVGGTNSTVFDGNGTFTNYGDVDLQTGTLEVSAGQDSGTFDTTNGTLMTFGQFILNGTNTFIGGGVLTNSILEGTNAVVEGTLAVAGQMTIGGTITIDSSAELQLLTSVTFDGYINGGAVPAIFTNNGTVLWTSNDQYGDYSPQIDNYGLWVAQSDNTFGGKQNAGETAFNNFGVFQKIGTSGTTTLDVNTVINDAGGTIQTSSGNLTIQNGSGNGLFNTASGSQLDLTTFDFIGDSTFTNGGSVTGSFEATNGVFHGTPELSNVSFSGIFTLANDCNLNVGTGGLGFYGYPNATAVTNYGTVTWAMGNLSGDNSPLIVNYGLWNVETDGVFNGRSSSGNTVFDNVGTFRKTAGQGGTTALNSFEFINTGLLDVQTGEVSMVANFIPGGGRVNFGLNSSNNFGNLYFPGTVTLGGTLSANLNNLFAPAASNSFPVVTYFGETGAFTNLSLPAGFVWTNNYGGSAFTLSVATVEPPQVTSAPAVQNGNFSFSFSAVPGQTYQIEDTTNLVPSNWVDVGAPIYVTNTSPITVSNLISVNPQLFYRLVLQ